MTNRAILLTVFVLALGAGPAAAGSPEPATKAPDATTGCRPAAKRTLTAALYPFLPDHESLFVEIERGFEADRGLLVDAKGNSNLGREEARR